LKRNPKTIDWDKLEAEWMGSSETLNIFRLRQKISSSYFYIKTDELDWVEKKAKIRASALEKASGRTIDGLARQWNVQLNLWKGLEMQVNALLSKTMDETRTKIIKPLKPGDLAAVSMMLSASLRSQKLIAGEPGEISEERNLSAHIAKIVTKIEREGGDTLGRSLIPPRRGKRI